MAEFLTDIDTLRANARAHMDMGPITEAYGIEDILTVEEEHADDLLNLLKEIGAPTL